jgi:hypothetical protein
MLRSQGPPPAATNEDAISVNKSENASIAITRLKLPEIFMPNYPLFKSKKAPEAFDCKTVI